MDKPNELTDRCIKMVMHEIEGIFYLLDYGEIDYFINELTKKLEKILEERKTTD